MIEEVKEALDNSKDTNPTRYSTFKRMLKDYFTDLYKQIFNEQGDRL